MYKMLRQETITIARLISGDGHLEKLFSGEIVGPVTDSTVC